MEIRLFLVVRQDLSCSFSCANPGVKREAGIESFCVLGKGGLEDPRRQDVLVHFRQLLAEKSGDDFEMILG